MPGKKRPTSAKQSAHSKRHKASGGGSKAKKGGAYPSADAAAADRAAKEARALAKKDRKGKGPAFIPVPEARGARRARDGESGSGADDDDDDDDEGMDVDPELLEGDGVDFLTRLDKKGMSACVHRPPPSPAPHPLLVLELTPLSLSRSQLPPDARQSLQGRQARTCPAHQGRLLAHQGRPGPADQVGAQGGQEARH